MLPQSLATGLETNPFVAIRDGQLELRRRDALEVPERVREVKRVIETHLPRIRGFRPRSPWKMFGNGSYRLHQH
jgi:hypothetical protein